MPVKPILVVGSTGLLGSEICHQLAINHYPARALVYPGSDLSRIQQLIDLGIEPVFGDVTDPGSLHRAFENIGTVISTISSGFSNSRTDSIDSIDKEGLENVIDAALEAAVDSFIYISFVKSPYKFPLQDAKQDIEQHLQRLTSMRYTILRPCFFMDLWLTPLFGFDPLNRKVTVYGSGANKISYIAVKDVARFVVASIMNPYAWNNLIDLGGEAISPLQVVKIFEEELGETFQLSTVPEEFLQHQFDIAYNALERSIVAMKLSYASGAEVDMKKTLPAFNLKLSTVRDYCKDVIPKQQKHSVMEQI